jgi:hypothetical protein
MRERRCLPARADVTKTLRGLQQQQRSCKHQRSARARGGRRPRQHLERGMWEHWSWLHWISAAIGPNTPLAHAAPWTGRSAPDQQLLAAWLGRRASLSSLCIARTSPVSPALAQRAAVTGPHLRRPRRPTRPIPVTAAITWLQILDVAQADRSKLHEFVAVVNRHCLAVRRRPHPGFTYEPHV